MDIRFERQMATDRPARRVAFFASWAKDHGETADRQVEHDPAWRSLFLPPEILLRPGIRSGVLDP
jgi:hypothetical protein